uniref:Prolyl 3-hydroxylase family member 4 (inactive) n=1 Tax=Acanthochromis polyacanthus TaxID=80966 RepID=A0A3Q1EKZ6_9TELE
FQFSFHYSLFILLCVTFVFMSAAQYENYNFRNFPNEELMPLTAAYGKALDNYAAGNWTESIRYLELSLRLHRFLRDSVRFCVFHCNRSEYDEPVFTTDTDLRVFWHVMMRASCLKKCRAHFPVLQLPPPGREILEDFNKRSVYRYLHSAHSKLNNLQQAVPCAFTFLQRNPEDQEMQQLMEEYKNQYDLSGFLIDHEERPYEVKRAQTLITFIHIIIVSDILNKYSLICCSTDVYVDVLRCKLKCEGNLMPNIGGYFVEKFVATVYHHLQYAYYKLNDGRSAMPCVYSYFLFEPEDQVMKQNLRYYKAYSEEWGLQTDHFTPRREAYRHYDQTVTQKQMLTFAEKYLKMSDEVRINLYILCYCTY